MRYTTIHYGTLDSAAESQAHGRLMGMSGARAAGPRVRDGMSGCGGLRGARRGGDFARARWRLPSRRVGLISEGVPDGVLGDGRLFTCRCGAAQLGSPQDAPSWSGLPKQLGHARPRAHMLARPVSPDAILGVPRLFEAWAAGLQGAAARCQATLSAPSRAPGLTRLAMAQCSS